MGCVMIILSMEKTSSQFNVSFTLFITYILTPFTSRNLEKSPGEISWPFENLNLLQSWWASETSFCIPTGRTSSWTLYFHGEWKFSQWFSMLINTIICFMTLHRIQDSVHISFSKMLPTTAELTAKLLNPGKTTSHNIPGCRGESLLLVWNGFCMTLFTSSARGFEAKSFLNKQESCNDCSSASPAFGLRTKAVRAKAGQGERAVCQLLPPLELGSAVPGCSVEHTQFGQLSVWGGVGWKEAALLLPPQQRGTKFTAVTKGQHSFFLLQKGVSL